MKKTASLLIIVLVLSSLCYFHVKNVYGVSYEFETSFEESDPFGNWTQDPVEGYGYEIQTDIVHSGVNACRSDDSTGSMTYELASNYSAHYCMVYFYINGSVPDGYGGGLFIRIWDPEITVYIETNATRGAGKSPYIRFYDQMDDDFNVLDPEGIALQTWHTVQIYTEGDSASANHKCWVNGRLIADVSDDTSGFNVTGVTIENFHWTGEYDGRVFVDDFRSNDDVPLYYFNFNFYDLDSEDVQAYVDWALWNSTHDIGYTEGASTLELGTYTLKTSKYGRVINTTTLDTEIYGNTTVNIYLNMKRHQTTPNGFIVSNETISTITVHEETPQLLNFTLDGTTPAHLGVGVSKNASHITDTKGVTVDLNTTVNHSYDDAYEKGNGPFYYDGDYLDAWSYTSPSDPSYRCSGFLFKNIALTSDTTITGASVEVFVLGTSYDDANFKIFGHAHDNAGNFKTGGTIIARPRTDANVSWVENSLGSGWQSKSGLQDVITEIITRAGWTSGNNLALLFIGNIASSKWFTTRSYDNNVIYGAKLSIQYLSSGNFTEWTYTNSPSHIDFVRNYFSTITMYFPASDQPDVGPNPTPSQHRVVVNVRLNGEWLSGCNVTVTGGPDDKSEWGLTDVFGRSIFRLKTGSYDIVATYEHYWKKKTIYVSKHMTIGIDFTETDYFPEGPPTDREIGPAWVGLPELDFTTQVFLVFVLPFIILILFAVKRILEGPKRKWKYSYLR